MAAMNGELKCIVLQNFGPQQRKTEIERHNMVITALMSLDEIMGSSRKNCQGELSIWHAMKTDRQRAPYSVCTFDAVPTKFGSVCVVNRGETFGAN